VLEHTSSIAEYRSIESNSVHCTSCTWRLIGGIGVYPIIAKATGYFKNARLTDKGLGGAGYGGAGVMGSANTPISSGAGV